MYDLSQLQHDFMDHMIGKPSPVIDQIESTQEAAADERLGIYASGYRLRLKEALDTDYNRLYGYLGDEHFDQLKDCYIDQYPSHNTSLRDYGQHMLELLAHQQPFSEVPVLLELAQIEQAFNASFDAANCVPVELSRLGELAAEDWSEMRLQFHSSLKNLHFSLNSFEIWKALSDEQAPPDLQHEDNGWIIWRKDLVSCYRPVEPAEAKALELACSGASFGEICAALLEYFDEEQTPVQAVTLLQSWIRDRMVCNLG